VLAAPGCLAPPPARVETPATGAGVATPQPVAVVATAPPPAEEAPAPTLGQPPRRASRRLSLRVRAAGCGTVVTGSGFAVDARTLVTNRHVVERATAVSVNTWDGQSVEAAVVGMATLEDLAIVEVRSPLPQPASLAPAERAAGDAVTVVAYPLGGPQRLDAGRVVDRVDGAGLGTSGAVLRLTAGVEPGSSGGPVLDVDGRVAGVVYARERATGYALAIPVAGVQALLDVRADRRPPPGEC
jgi:S1-C subfamily serine protease